MASSAKSEVVAGFSNPGEDLFRIPEQIRRPLVRFAAHEPVKILESHATRPLVEGASSAVLLGGGVVFLTKPRRCVTILLQDFTDGGTVRTDDGIVARIPGVGEGRYLPSTVVVALVEHGTPVACCA
jgi:hypothetical protein